jgi:cytochrome c oxidase subunit IV
MNGNSLHAIRQLWIRNGSILLVELVLLAISITAAYIPMNNYNSAVNLTIAGIMAVIGLLFFMDLIHDTALLRLAAAAGFFWLIIMFPLTFADYFTRPG